MRPVTCHTANIGESAIFLPFSSANVSSQQARRQRHATGSSFMADDVIWTLTITLAAPWRHWGSSKDCCIPEPPVRQQHCRELQPDTLPPALHNKSSFKEIQAENVHIYNINEVIIQTYLHKWINKLLSEENKAPEHSLKLKGGKKLQHLCLSFLILSCTFSPHWHLTVAVRKKILSLSAWEQKLLYMYYHHVIQSKISQRSNQRIKAESALMLRG